MVLCTLYSGGEIIIILLRESDSLGETHVSKSMGGYQDGTY